MFANPKRTMSTAPAPITKPIIVIRESHLDPPKNNKVTPKAIKAALTIHLLSFKNLANEFSTPQLPSEATVIPLD